MSIFDKQSPLNPLTPGGTRINSLHAIDNFQKNWLDRPRKDPTIDRAPLDKSAYGFLDEALRLLPPTLRREAEKLAKVGPYIAMKMVTANLIKLASDSVSSVVYHPGKYNISGVSGGITRGHLVEKITAFLAKYGIPFDSGSPDSILYMTPATGFKQTIMFNEDSVTKSFNTAVNESGLNTPTYHHKNKLVDEDRYNIHQFIPRQRMFWTINLQPYVGVDGTVIPELGNFSSKYDSRVIDYRSWIPVINYTYERNTMGTLEYSYGWGQEFRQMNVPSRGRSFSMELMDDRDHNISNYLNHIGELAANYEKASLTYWRKLCHVIEVSTYSHQWELIARFKLIGILQNIGIATYQSDDDTNSLKCIFSVVGELNDSSTKVEKFKPREVSKVKVT